MFPECCDSDCRPTPPLETDDAVGARRDDDTLTGLVILGFVVLLLAVVSGVVPFFVVCGALAAEAVVGLVSLDDAAVAVVVVVVVVVVGFVGTRAAVDFTVAFLDASTPAFEAAVLPSVAVREIAARVVVFCVVVVVGVDEFGALLIGASTLDSGIDPTADWAKSFVVSPSELPKAPPWLEASTWSSLLIVRLEMLDSPLRSRCKPRRPFFSTATKLVRTLERGLGPSEVTEVSN